jgi:hypothetical protein
MTDGEGAVVWVLVHVLGPLGVAAYFAVVLRRSGGWRLWWHVVFVTEALAAFAIWQRDTVFYDYGPMVAEGVDSWAFPPAALVAAVAVHALSRLSVPAVVAVALAAALASLAIVPFHWIS